MYMPLATPPTSEPRHSNRPPCSSVAPPGVTPEQGARTQTLPALHGSTTHAAGSGKRPTHFRPDPFPLQVNEASGLAASVAQAAPPAPPAVNQASLQQIVDMGFSAARAELALRRVGTQTLHVAAKVARQNPGLAAPVSCACPAHAVTASRRLLPLMLLPTTADSLHQLLGCGVAGTQPPMAAHVFVSCAAHVQIATDSVELAMEWMDAHPEEPPPPPAPGGQEAAPTGSATPSGQPEEDPTVVSNVKAALGSYWEAAASPVPPSGEASTSEAPAAEVPPQLLLCRCLDAVGQSCFIDTPAWHPDQVANGSRVADRQA